ncbi:MAG: hypothetical protein ACTSV3_08870 [Candidatus Thorarchaeota archaeon]
MLTTKARNPNVIPTTDGMKIDMENTRPSMQEHAPQQMPNALAQSDSGVASSPDVGSLCGGRSGGLGGGTSISAIARS